MYSAMRHAYRFTWDFWYYYDPDSKLFHVLYLNADPALVPDGRHHFASKVGYGVTSDFYSIEWISDNIFCANWNEWDNTSIWSGDIVRTKDNFLLFYTARDGREGDGLTQNIGLAQGAELRQLKRVPGFRLEPEAKYYETCTLPGDTFIHSSDPSIHAWRDPFLFKYGTRPYILLSTKSNNQDLSRKGAIGLLRSKDGGLKSWEALAPIYAPGWYTEMEVPQLYSDPSGNYVLVYSSWAKGDGAPNTNRAGGLHGVDMFFSNKIKSARFPDKPRVMISEKSGLYACRIIPELGGEIIGFDTRSGGIRRSGIKTGLKHVDRDFSSCDL